MQDKLNMRDKDIFDLEYKLEESKARESEATAIHFYRSEMNM